MSHKFKVLVTRRIPQKAIDILHNECEVDYWNSDDCISEEVLTKKIKNKHGLLCLLTDTINSKILDNAGNQLKVVSTMSVGVDHIDLQECEKRNIKVGYTPDILTSATAELAVGLLLSVSRRIVEGVNSVKNNTWGPWKPMWMCGPSLQGATVGIFGMGRIGQAIVDRLRPFKVDKFIYNSASKKSPELESRLEVDYVSFEDLLERSDFIVSSCALNSSTENIFNKTAFAKMKKNCIFTNIARGKVVNQNDLFEALSSNQIAGCGLDVTDPEPLPGDHKLLTLNNCVITPHIGSASLETRTQMAVMAAENLLCGLKQQKMPAQYKI